MHVDPFFLFIGDVQLKRGVNTMSAKPLDPNAFGRIVADEAVNLHTVGVNVSETATSTDFGVADEIALFKDLVGGSPNPPGSHSAVDHISTVGADHHLSDWLLV